MGYGLLWLKGLPEAKVREQTSSRRYVSASRELRLDEHFRQANRRIQNDLLSQHTGEAIEAGCPVLQWLVRWAAMLCTRYSIGRDAQTAHERMRGRKCNNLVIPFGESVRMLATRPSLLALCNSSNS